MRDLIVQQVLRPALAAAFSMPPSSRRLLAWRPVRRDGLTLDRDTQCLLSLVNRVDMPLPTRQHGVLRAARAQMSEGMQVLAGARTSVHVKDLELPGAESSLPCRLYVPAGADDTLLLYFHGGGFVLGDVNSHDALCRLLAEEAGVKVLLVSYRKAPEHPWPAAVLDVERVYREVISQSFTFGVTPDRIVLGGDSAGANLATVLARRLLSTDLPQPLAQLLIYPVTDFASQHRSRQLFAEGFLLTGELIERFRNLYSPADLDRHHPDVSPLHAPDLRGMPPTLLITAGFDPLRDEGEAYGEALAKAGVGVTMIRHAGLVHGFANMLCIDAARRATADMAHRLALMVKA